MPNVGFFDPELRGESWFDDELVSLLDDEFVDLLTFDDEAWAPFQVLIDQTLVSVWG